MRDCCWMDSWYELRLWKAERGEVVGMVPSEARRTGGRLAVSRTEETVGTVERGEEVEAEVIDSGRAKESVDV